MNELDLPQAPPLPPEVREHALAKVFAAVDAPPRRRRPFAVVAVAAAVVVALLVTMAVATSGLRGDDPLRGVPAAPLTSVPPAPAPQGGRSIYDDPTVQSLPTRCADAVQKSGKAAQYPPVDQWRITFAMGAGALEPELVINDDFACLLTPTTVTVSGRASAQPQDVTVVRMSEGDIVVLDPKQLEYAVGEQPDKMAISSDAVAFHMLYGPGVPAQILLMLTGRTGADRSAPPFARDPAHPAPALDTSAAKPVRGVAEPAVTIVDRPFPKRPDTPDGAALKACMDRSPTHAYSFPEYWTPVARHEKPGAPAALLARIGDVAVGYCSLDPPPAGLPAYYWTFDGMALKALRDPGVAEVVAGAHPVFGVATAVLRLPPGVARAVMTQHPPAGGKGSDTECTIAADLAICTAAVPESLEAKATEPMPTFSYATFTSPDPGARGTPVR